MASRVFKSAVDWWYYGIIGCSALILLVVMASVIPTGSPLAIIVVIFSMVAGLGLPVWLLFSTHYIVEGSRLLVRSGPFSWNIARSEIKSIRPTRSPLSSPALSLQRLEITYVDGKVLLISPKNQDEFVDAIGLPIH